MRLPLVLVAALLAGCAGPANAPVSVDLALRPVVVGPADTLEANATVTNRGAAPVALWAGCSSVASFVVLAPNGTRVNALPEGCPPREEATNTLAPGVAAGHDVEFPPQFWRNHPEAGPGTYTIVAWTEWRDPASGEWVRAEDRAEFRWTG